MAKTFTGIVTSDKANKTIVVTVTSRETHPIYGKQYTITRKYAVHDAENSAKKGDKVIISETRPFSKSKSFKLDTIVEKSHGSIEIKDELEAIQSKPIEKAPVDKPSKELDKKNKARPPKLQDEVLADKEDKK